MAPSVPYHFQMNCSLIRYLISNEETARAREIVARMAASGAELLSFAAEEISISEMFDDKNSTDIDAPVSPWKLPLICLAASENNQEHARALASRGSKIGCTAC